MVKRFKHDLTKDADLNIYGYIVVIVLDLMHAHFFCATKKIYQLIYQKTLNLNHIHCVCKIFKNISQLIA